MHLSSLQWYLLTVATLIVVVSAWASIAYGDDGDNDRQRYQERLRHFASLCIECSVSAAAYWALIFVLALVIAAGLWLIILMLVWVPSDFFHHYFGADVFSRALQNIKPLIYRSAGSPGMTGIPMLDYLSLSAAYILGPWCGIWSILGKYQSPNAASSSTPGAGS